MSADSRIFFLNGGDKVDPTQGYLQADPEGRLSQSGNEWVEKPIDQSYINTMYTKTCDCKEGDHDYGINAVYDRIPDYIYWGAEDGSGAILITTN